MTFYRGAFLVAQTVQEQVEPLCTNHSSKGQQDAQALPG
jgi:hypothetical protein